MPDARRRVCGEAVAAPLRRGSISLSFPLDPPGDHPPPCLLFGAMMAHQRVPLDGAAYTNMGKSLQFETSALKFIFSLAHFFARMLFTSRHTAALNPRSAPRGAAARALIRAISRSSMESSSSDPSTPNDRSNSMKRLCVFCGSSFGKRPGGRTRECAAHGVAMHAPCEA